MNQLAILFFEEDIANLASPFKFALVGKFSHGRHTSPEIKYSFKKFGLKSNYTIKLLDGKRILIRFYNEEYYHCVWLREQQYLTSYPLRIFKWTPNFRVDVETLIAPVWANFRRLPIHFYQKPNLFSIASTLGVPLKMDAATTDITRPSVARVCVEMDLLKKFPHKIWIGSGSNGYWQCVTYEKFPKYCSKCYSQGHAVEDCEYEENDARPVEIQ